MQWKIILVPLLFLSVAGCNKKPEPQVTNKPPQPVPPATDSTVAFTSHRKVWMVSTIAGNGTASFVNGTALSATFHFPEDVAVAEDGSIYVTDVVNSCIRKIEGGKVSTFAGGRGFDIVDGNAATAQFKNPYGITLDKEGNLFTTDDSDPRIRKIAASSFVSIHAGTAKAGLTDGTADTARFSTGGYLTSDPQGDLFVSDGLNNKVRKISPTGEVTTIAKEYSFSYPGGIVIDLENNLYVVNRTRYNIVKISSSGAVTVFSGSGTPGFRDGSASESQFSADMRDLAIDSSGNLYLSDDNRIRKINAQGEVTTIAGSDAGFNDGQGSMAKFNYPNGLAVDRNGSIYVADLNNNRIRKISFE